VSICLSVCLCDEGVRQGVSGALRLFSAHFTLNSSSEPSGFHCSCKSLSNGKFSAVVNCKNGNWGGIPSLITSEVKALCLKRKYLSHFTHAIKIPKS
jgi:hypothetical protein